MTLLVLARMLSFFAGSTNQTKDGSVVRKCRVADKSASISFSLWNEQAGAIEAGDILKLTKGLTIKLELFVVCVCACVCDWISHAHHLKRMFKFC